MRNWPQVRLRFVADLNPSKSEVSKLERQTLVSFLPMEAIGERGSLDLSREREIGDVETGYTYFRDGDVIIAKITPCYENGKGALAYGLTNGIGFGTTELIVIRPRRRMVLSRFLYWLLFAPSFRKQGEATMYGAGGQKRVPDDFVRDFRAQIPPLDEQHQIVDFLDRETAKIDSLVDEQQKLIALLTVKRRSAISHAVTQGINPAVPMKNSGVEWLGDIPADWGVTRLKYAASNIIDCPHETPTYSDDGRYLVIRTADVVEGILNVDSCRRLDEAEYLHRIRRGELLPGDIVYGREGERWGFAAKVPSNPTFCLGQRMMQVRASADFDPDYLMWHLNATPVYRQGQLDTVGATSPHVNVETIRNYWLAQPPIPEQRKIAAFLASETARIDCLISDAYKVSSLLQERRAALISAAVTGQIAVRERSLAEVT